MKLELMRPWWFYWLVVSLKNYVPKGLTKTFLKVLKICWLRSCRAVCSESHYEPSLGISFWSITQIVLKSALMASCAALVMQFIQSADSVLILRPSLQKHKIRFCLTYCSLKRNSTFPLFSQWYLKAQEIRKSLPKKVILCKHYYFLTTIPI